MSCPGAALRADPAVRARRPAHHRILAAQAGGDLSTRRPKYVRNPVNLADLGKKENYAAFVVGGEYTFSGIFESEADLSLLAEWLIDGRRRRATNQYQNDLFLGARLSLNDVQGAAFTLGTLTDLDFGTRTLSLEFDRRLTDSVSVKAEAILMLHVGKKDATVYPTRRDSFVGAKLAYSF